MIPAFSLPISAPVPEIAGGSRQKPTAGPPHLSHPQPGRPRYVPPYLTNPARWVRACCFHFPSLFSSSRLPSSTASALLSLHHRHVPNADPSGHDSASSFLTASSGESQRQPRARILSQLALVRRTARRHRPYLEFVIVLLLLPAAASRRSSRGETEFGKSDPAPLPTSCHSSTVVRP